MFAPSMPCRALFRVAPYGGALWLSDLVRSEEQEFGSLPCLHPQHHAGWCLCGCGFGPCSPMQFHGLSRIVFPLRALRGPLSCPLCAVFVAQVPSYHLPSVAVVFLGPTQSLGESEIWLSLLHVPLAPDDMPVQVSEALVPEHHVLSPTPPPTHTHTPFAGR